MNATLGNCRMGCTWKCNDECLFSKLQRKKVIECDKFISLLKKTPRNACLMMNQVIRYCNDTSNIVSIFSEIYNRYGNFNIFGGNGLSSIHMHKEIEWDEGSRSVSYEPDDSFIEYAIKGGHILLIEYLVQNGVLMHEHNEYDEYESKYPLYTAIRSNILVYMIDKHDILNLTPTHVKHNTDPLCYAFRVDNMKSFDVLIKAMSPEEIDHVRVIETLCKYSKEPISDVIDKYGFKSKIQQNINSILTVELVRYDYITQKEIRSINISYLLTNFDISSVTTRTLISILMHSVFKYPEVVHHLIQICDKRDDIAVDNNNAVLFYPTINTFSDPETNVRYTPKSSPEVCKIVSNELIPFVYKHGGNCSRLLVHVLQCAPNQRIIKDILSSLHEFYRSNGMEDVFIQNIYIALPSIIIIGKQNCDIVTEILQCLTKIPVEKQRENRDVQTAKIGAFGFGKRVNILNYSRMIEVLCRFGQSHIITNCKLCEKDIEMVQNIEESVTNERNLISKIPNIPTDIAYSISKFIKKDEPQEWYKLHIACLNS